MKIKHFDEIHNDDDLAPEFTFDYDKAKHNRFAAKDKKRKMTVVVLDEDVVKSFLTLKRSIKFLEC